MIEIWTFYIQYKAEETLKVEGYICGIAYEKEFV